MGKQIRRLKSRWVLGCGWEHYPLWDGFPLSSREKLGLEVVEPIILWEPVPPWQQHPIMARGY